MHAPWPLVDKQAACSRRRCSPLRVLNFVLAAQFIAVGPATTFALVDGTALTHAHPANSARESSKGTVRTRWSGDMGERVALVVEPAPRKSLEGQVMLGTPPVAGVLEQPGHVVLTEGARLHVREAEPRRVDPGPQQSSPPGVAAHGCRGAISVHSVNQKCYFGATHRVGAGRRNDGSGD